MTLRKEYFMRATTWIESMLKAPLQGRSIRSLFPWDRGFLGLDVETSRLRLVEIQCVSGELLISRVAEAATTNGPLNTCIAQLLRNHTVRARRAATAVPDADVITKRLTIPAGSGDFESSIWDEAARCIPEDLANVNLDYQVLGPANTTSKLEVLLVAARREIVDSRATSMREAGLKPAVVDVTSFALLNAFESNYDYPVSGSVILIHVGERHVTLAVAQSGRLLLAVDVPAAAAAPPEDGDIESWVHELVEELHHALSFYWHPGNGDAASTIYLSGVSACLPSLRRHFCERMQTPVEVFDPFLRQRLHPSIDTDELRAQASAYTIAVGLALRGFAQG